MASDIGAEGAGRPEPESDDADRRRDEDPGRLSRQLAFLLEADRLKQVERQTAIIGGSRRENTAEHSWHLGLFALVLAEHADEAVDVARVVAMVLVHDLVEIDAGDTFAYDETGYETKAAREQAAADRLFGLLPDGQGGQLRARCGRSTRPASPPTPASPTRWTACNPCCSTTPPARTCRGSAMASPTSRSFAATP